MAQVKVFPQTRPLIEVRRPAIVAELVTLLLIASAIAIVVYGQRRPEALPVTAPAEVFASGRAMEHLRQIANHPHPVGTAEHSAVRDYLLQQLNALGFVATVQRTTGINQQLSNPVTAGTVENIVVKLPGTQNQQAILLMGHYDSVPTGPGAADNSSAVAAILETARALRTHPPLKNDLILLFTDAEEAGLLGASAFMAQHPYAREVGVALNFEARGAGGPVLMFETSAGNAQLIREFAESAPYPATNSLLYEIYKLLPNDTDLTIFKQARLRGLNFAFVEQPTHYHTQLDSIGNIDERSLQQQGSYLLSVTRRLGNSDPTAATSQNAVYFDLFSYYLVHYPQSWALPLTIVVLLVFVIVVALGIKRGQLRLSGIALGVLSLVLSVAATYVMVSLVWRVVLMLHSQYQLLSSGDTYNSEFYVVSFLALTAAITAAVGALFGRRVAMQDLWVGALGGWLVVLILTTLFLPGASYLFTWPLLVSVVALLLVLVSSGQTHSTSLKRSLLLFAGVAVGLVLFVPAIRVLLSGLTVANSAVAMVAVALLLGLFVPQIQLLTNRRRWLVPGALALVSAAFLIAGSFTSGFEESRPRPNNIFYGFDAAAGKAVWASADSQTDEWTKHFFSQQTEVKSLPEFFPLRSARFRTAAAPLVSFSPPDVKVLGDTTNNGVRTLRLNIKSTRQAAVVSLGVESDMEVRGTTLNGEQIKTEAARLDANKWGLRYFAIPPEGIELTLEAKSAQPLAIRVVDQSYGLPQNSYSPRPASTMPAPLPFSDSTFVSRSFSF